MQILNCLLALGGDSDNVIPKFNVTPSEIALLRAIHGEDAISDIKVVGEEKRSGRDERARLEHLYARQMPDGTRRSPELNNLFPGIAARLFETIDELDLPEEMFLIERDVRRAARAERAAAEAAETVPVEEPEEGTDDGIEGVGEIDDGIDEEDEPVVETEENLFT